MANFNKKNWLNAGESGATDDNSVINKTNMNDLEGRIDEAINGVFYDNAGFHNAIFRGKDITNYLDDGSLWEKISSGTFEDLYIGDYFLKNNIKWRVASFDYYLHTGSAEHYLTKHHAIIIPDCSLLNSQMNDIDSTEGGVIVSKMYTETFKNILDNYITPIFGNHVLEFYNGLSSKIENDKASSANWYIGKLNLLSELMIYGTLGFGASGIEIGNSATILPLFQLAPEYIFINNESYWLRSIANSTQYACIRNTGILGTQNAKTSFGIRPYFLIGK